MGSSIPDRGPSSSQQDVVELEPIFQRHGMAVVRWRCRVRETGESAMLAHRSHVLKFVHTGAFRVSLDDGPVMVDATRTLLAAPHVPFEVTKQFGPAVAGSAVAISPEAMANLLPQWSGREFATTRVLRAEVTPRVLVMQHVILRHIEDGAAPEVIEELVGMLAADAFRKPQVVAFPKRRATVIPRRDAVDMALAILAARYDSDLRLEDIARAIGISPFHLSRAFKRVTGIAMHQHLMRLRLRAALAQVVDPHRALSDIAHEHAFSSHSHFAASFRKEFDVTPSEVRRLTARPVHELRAALGFDRDDCAMF